MGKRVDALDRQIAARLKGLRERAGLSQAEVGAALGVSFQQVQKYEAGVNRISGGAIVRLARLFEVSALLLLGLPVGSGDPGARPPPAWSWPRRRRARRRGRRLARLPLGVWGGRG